MKAPTGETKEIMAASVSWFSPGGSADGTPANTPEKWNYLPLNGAKGKGGYQIIFEYTPAAVDGIDASDCFFQLPILVNGNRQIMGNSAHASGLVTDAFTVDLTFADYTTVAAQTTQIYKVRAKEGTVFQIGGDRVNISIEDDTA